MTGAAPGGERTSGASSSLRRQLTAAVGGAALAGAAALFAGGQRWVAVTVVRPPPLPPVDAVLTGGDAAPLVPAMGLLLLASAVALVAVRGWGRPVLGLVTAVAGGVLLWSGIRTLAGTVDVSRSDLPGLSDALDGIRTDVSPAWPGVVVAAGVLAVATAVLVVLRGRAWPGMGRRYERGAGTGTAAPAARGLSGTDEERTQAAWRALDRGEDPTEAAADPRPDAPGGGTP